MKLVVGLGNPGKKYQSTRHNVGFDVLAAVAKQHSGGPVRGKFQGDVVDIHCAGGRALLLGPTTYMNRSGQSVRAAFDFYKLELTDLLVVCDDFNLDLGRLRFRMKGSAGGQPMSELYRNLQNKNFKVVEIDKKEDIWPEFKKLFNGHENE